MLSPESVSEFKNLYLKEYGVLLTDNQAFEYGNRLIGLIKAVYGTDLSKVFVDKANNKKDN